MKTQQALQAARDWITIHGEHDNECDVLGFDEDGRHNECDCGLVDTLALIDEALTEKVEPVGVVESAVVGAGGFHVCLADGVAMPKVGDSLYAAHPAPAQQGPQEQWPHVWGCRANAFGPCDKGCLPPFNPAQQETTCPECNCYFIGDKVTAPGTTRLVNTAPVNAKLLEACKTGLEYVEQCLSGYEQAYGSHPATEAGWEIIRSDIDSIRAVIAQAEGEKNAV